MMDNQEGGEQGSNINNFIYGVSSESQFDYGLYLNDSAAPSAIEVLYVDGYEQIIFNYITIKQGLSLLVF